MVQSQTRSHPTWSKETELIGLEFELESPQGGTLYPQYAIALHAWFLDQVRQLDPKLSAKLHDNQQEKSFALSGLNGRITSSGKQLLLAGGETYRWYVSGFSGEVVKWMQDWMAVLPDRLPLRQAPLQIKSVAIAPDTPATTYKKIFQVEPRQKLGLSFCSPTSFRRNGVHFPLPVPFNLFHSYLRRWNSFSEIEIEREEFLEWVDKSVWITQHRLESAKVAAGKKGMVTGFIGSVELSFTKEAYSSPEYMSLLSSLVQFAPYCGTGHKTTFGLGQTRLGWRGETIKLPSSQQLLAQRIEDLTAQLMATQKRTGGDRAWNACEIRATILARQEFGESLQEIATDLEMPYETVKTYGKLARRSLKLLG